MLPNVDPQLIAYTLGTELKFNSNYYRIYSPQEIDEAERATATRAVQDAMRSQSQVQGVENDIVRRVSQTTVNFPASPEEITRDFLTAPNPAGTEDSD